MNIDLNKKYQIYNSMLLNLSYQDSKNVGHLLPLLTQYAKLRLDEGINPVEILESFIANHEDIVGKDKASFLFKIIQYVERQIVLFDSIEDSISPFQLEDGNVLKIDDLFSMNKSLDARKELLAKLNDFKVRIVLTAHPTQFYRPAVLNIISNLTNEITANHIGNIDKILHQLGLTSLVNSKNPTPIEEARNILLICRYYYYDAIGEFFEGIQRSLPEFDNPELVSLGFWPCGDRDGNPNVTHKTTKDVSDALRMTLMKCYYNEVKALESKMTFKGVDEILYSLRQRLYTAMFDTNYVIDYTELISTLKQVETKIIDDYQSLYISDLKKLLFKVQVFKNHFASLDIRQNHDVHLQTVSYILKKAAIIKDSIDELTKEQLISYLVSDTIKIADYDDAPDRVKDTIKNISQLKALQKMNGEQGCHRYIISNSEDSYAVLFVYGLMRWISNDDILSFDIIPLFETMTGMTNSENIMNELFSVPQYREHVARRKNEQTIMLGFSDGTKDGGYLKANWAIFQSKEVLTSVCEKQGIKPVFFDGRGGPPARGGGKTYKFYASQGSAIANNQIQLTIQGQTITSTYGTKDKFKFNAEQMVTSGLYNFLHRKDSSISIDDRKRIEELSELSFMKYKELKNHEKFLPYLEKMTTLKYYSLARIGSRPSKRNSDAKLSLTDLRAIAYVGSWAQLKQNIPGYFGIGTAIFKMKSEGRMDELKQLYKDVPFFRTLIKNSMMSLTKCYFELTSYIKEVEEFSEFWKYLYEEYELSKEMILEMTGFDELMQDEEKSKLSIQTREEIVLPLLIVQNYALQKSLAKLSDTEKETYKKVIIRSLYGNINASRNSV